MSIVLIPICLQVIEYLSNTLANVDPDRVVKLLELRYCSSCTMATCEVSNTTCNELVTEITPVMMTTLSSWVIENQVDICNVDNSADNTLPSLFLTIISFMYLVNKIF